MRENNGGFDDLVRVAPLVLTVVISVLVLVGLTDLGQMKTFRFLVGEAAVVTAIAYSFQAARRMGKSTPILVAIWFGIASLQFAQAVWLVAK